MKSYSVWQLIQNGFFQEACTKADSEFEQTKDYSVLRNKLYALFHLKNYDECILLSKEIIDLDRGQTDSDFIFLGIAYWLCDRKDIALKIWQKGMKSKYTDAAGGIELQIFIFFASIKMNDDNLKEKVFKKIQNLVKSKGTQNYPGILGRYLLNEITEEVLFVSVSNIPVLKERQLCQINFTIAVKKLETRDTEGYLKKLKTAISFGPNSYLEQMYYLALGELDTLD